MNVGLKQGTVEIVDYNPNWVVEFEMESARLKAVLPSSMYPYEHIGSTAIAGMPAKPIIDFIVGVTNLKHALDQISILEQLGYEHRINGDNESRILFVRGSPECRTHHFSFVIRGSQQWNDSIGLRDLLRSNPDLARRYADLKQKLALLYSKDRASYTKCKEPFFAEVFKLVLKRVLI